MADEAFVFDIAHWAPFLEKRQRKVFDGLYPDGGSTFERVRRYVLRLNRGEVPWLVPFLKLFLDRGLGGLRRPTMRWVMLHFFGDIVAYQRTPEPSEPRIGSFLR